MQNVETAKLAQKAANALGGYGELARHLNIGRAYVMRFINGRNVPNAITTAELRRIVAERAARDDEETSRTPVRGKETTNGNRTS